MSDSECRDPPPYLSDDEAAEEEADLFGANDEEKPPPKPTEDSMDEEDLFAEANSEINLDTPVKSNQLAFDDDEGADADPHGAVPKVGVTESSTAASAPSKPLNNSEKRSKAEIDEDEGGDQFNIDINITDPKKIGDGFGSYMAYKVNTKTTYPEFRHGEMSVYRRFSDFLGLHDKLVEKHLHEGYIIPPPPEKSVVGMTKIKMSKEDQASGDFVEKRRAALERFLNRSAKHSVLRNDAIFVEFLSHDGDLPKSTSTSALSGAGVMRLFNRVGDSIGKITFKMDEADQSLFMRTYFCQLLPYDETQQWNEQFEWFEEKQTQIESLDQQLRKLHTSVEALVTHRKELAMNTSSFAKSAAMLGNAEEHTSLSRALSQLAEIEEKVEQMHMDQADSDFYVLSELIKDYISLIASVKEVFHERVKIFKNWKEAEAMLAKKREVKAKFELARKMDKVPQAEQEIAEWEQRVDREQEDFEKMSKNIRSEMTRFEKQRVRDFKGTVINYLETLMNNQQQLIKYWEAFIPEAKAIA